MAIDRSNTYGGLPGPNGEDFLTQYGSYMDALIDTATMRLTSVSGADVITAAAEPFSVPGTGLVTGMKFSFEAVSDNTGAVTLNVDSSGAVSVVNGDGTLLAAGDLASGTRYVVEYDGSNYVLIDGTTADTSGTSFSRTVHDASAVWINDVSPDAIVMVELWGAGAGGNIYGGGGGGGHARGFFKASDLGASETITVAAGAASGADGGNSTFGSHLTAYGGEKPGIGTGGGWGKGGGELESGADGGAIGGGQGDGASATTLFGGGAGGDGSNNGGDAVFGGAGGSDAGDGGRSVYGGEGGAASTAGSRPGGGGGESAAGGGGRCIITVFGG